MLYAISCYHSEQTVKSWTKADDDAVIAKLETVRRETARNCRLGAVARLLPTAAATTLRKDRNPPQVIDGPFSETKEQLLGFYVVECPAMDQALDVARRLGRSNGGGVYEIRPIAWLDSGGATA